MYSVQHELCFMILGLSYDWVLHLAPFPDLTQSSLTQYEIHE